MLVREASLERLEDLIERWRIVAGAPAGKRVEPVIGDLRRPLLGIEKERVNELRGKVGDFFHLAAVYDMTAPAEINTAVNVGGTTHAVELARALEVERLHHVSSIAVAGAYKGVFEESMFDEGQKLPSPYHRTKFESERIVREQPYVPWRVYRPAVVVGDSETGEMDKIDGPYYFFKAIQQMRRVVPEWVPLVGLDLGRTNVVPVDWVAATLDHIAHEPGLDGRAFHLQTPRAARGRGLQRVRRRRARAAVRGERRPPAERRGAEMAPGAADARAPDQPGAPDRAARAGHTGGGSRAHGADAKPSARGRPNER